MHKRKNIDSLAILVLVILCITWGFHLVVIKVTSADVSPLMQAGIRSIIATIGVSLWTISRGQPLFEHDGTLRYGIYCGILFTLEFVFIYWGLEYTNASRAVIFLYTTPFIVALGTRMFVPEEKLRSTQYLGLVIAFVGILIAFGESLGLPSRKTLIGDGMLFLGAIFWGGTIILVKASPLARIAASKTLLYQLAVSALLLPAASWVLNEPGIINVTELTILSLLFQGIWIASITYLAWYWLILHYPAPKLASFTFLTPIFGVLAGWLLLDESLSFQLLTAMLFVACGIYLVNKNEQNR